MGLGKTLTMISLIVSNPQTLADMKKIKTPFRYISRATLVVVPNHLAKQWEEEVKKFVSTKLKVIVITTILQHRKYSYQHFCMADIIIVSTQFLKNNKYTELSNNIYPEGRPYEKRYTTPLHMYAILSSFNLSF